MPTRRQEGFTIPPATKLPLGLGLAADSPRPGAINGASTPSSYIDTSILMDDDIWKSFTSDVGGGQSNHDDVVMQEAQSEHQSSASAPSHGLDDFHAWLSLSPAALASGGATTKMPGQTVSVAMSNASTSSPYTEASSVSGGNTSSNEGGWSNNDAAHVSSSLPGPSAINIAHSEEAQASVGRPSSSTSSSAGKPRKRSNTATGSSILASVLEEHRTGLSLEADKTMASKTSTGLSRTTSSGGRRSNSISRKDGVASSSKRRSPSNERSAVSGSTANDGGVGKAPKSRSRTGRRSSFATAQDGEAPATSAVPKRPTGHSRSTSAMDVGGLELKLKGLANASAPSFDGIPIPWTAQPWSTHNQGFSWPRGVIQPRGSGAGDQSSPPAQAAPSSSSVPPATSSELPTGTSWPGVSRPVTAPAAGSAPAPPSAWPAYPDHASMMALWQAHLTAMHQYQQQQQQHSPVPPSMPAAYPFAPTGSQHPVAPPPPAAMMSPWGEAAPTTTQQHQQAFTHAHLQAYNAMPPSMQGIFQSMQSLQVGPAGGHQGMPMQTSPYPLNSGGLSTPEWWNLPHDQQQQQQHAQSTTNQHQAPAMEEPIDFDELLRRDREVSREKDKMMMMNGSKASSSAHTASSFTTSPPVSSKARSTSSIAILEDDEEEEEESFQAVRPTSRSQRDSGNTASVRQGSRSLSRSAGRVLEDVPEDHHAISTEGRDIKQEGMDLSPRGVSMSNVDRQATTSSSAKTTTTKKSTAAASKPSAAPAATRKRSSSTSQAKGKKAVVAPPPVASKGRAKTTHKAAAIEDSSAIVDDEDDDEEEDEDEEEEEDMDDDDDDTAEKSRATAKKGGKKTTTTADDGAAATGGPKKKTATERYKRRRESHNLVERRRRDVINERIAELAKLLPDGMLLDAIRGSTGGGNESKVVWVEWPGESSSNMDTEGGGDIRGRMEELLAIQRRKEEMDGDDSLGPEAINANGKAPTNGQARPNKGIILRKSVEYIRLLQEYCESMGTCNRMLREEVERQKSLNATSSSQQMASSTTPGGLFQASPSSQEGTTTKGGMTLGCEIERPRRDHHQHQLQQSPPSTSSSPFDFSGGSTLPPSLGEWLARGGAHHHGA